MDRSELRRRFAVEFGIVPDSLGAAMLREARRSSPTIAAAADARPDLLRGPSLADAAREARAILAVLARRIAPRPRERRPGAPRSRARRTSRSTRAGPSGDPDLPEGDPDHLTARAAP